MGHHSSGGFLTDQELSGAAEEKKLVCKAKAISLMFNVYLFFWKNGEIRANQGGTGGHVGGARTRRTQL